MTLARAVSDENDTLEPTTMMATTTTTATASRMSNTSRLG